MRTMRTVVLAALATATLAATGCRNSDDGRAAEWRDQPAETNGAPVTGKRITPDQAGTGGSGDEGTCADQLATCQPVKE